MPQGATQATQISLGTVAAGLLDTNMVVHGSPDSRHPHGLCVYQLQLTSIQTLAALGPRTWKCPSFVL